NWWDVMIAELSEERLSKIALVNLTNAVHEKPEKHKMDLNRHAELHSKRWGEPIDATALIPHMLEAFIAHDRAFRKARPASRRLRKVPGLARASSIKASSGADMPQFVCST